MLHPKDQARSRAGGEVFTRGWVVDLILDLLDYRPHRDLTTIRLVEPACGTGAFLVPIAHRISAACRARGWPIRLAQPAVRAFDLRGRNVTTARERVRAALVSDGWSGSAAGRIATAWVRRGDYLLDDPPDREPADLVVGNPPYLRLEAIPGGLLQAYRRACPAMVGRADLYVGFFDRALATLRPGGRLGFICADRWMRNQYGRALRAMITSRYAIETVLTMHQVDAFEAAVLAYPAITIIRNGPQGPAVVARAGPTFGPAAAAKLTSWIRGGTARPLASLPVSATRLSGWFPAGDDFWPAASPAGQRLLAQLTDRYLPLGDPACGVRVGIGVATGADAVFIASGRAAPVEPDRLLPLAMVADLSTGRLAWAGHHLINPWDDHGELVDLARYPLLARYFARHEPTLRRRHVGRRQPERWYRTIDKVDPALTGLPKLLFADLKLTSEPVLDPGGHYPHHNLYHLTSPVWDLRVLGGLLLSKVAEAIIGAYAVRMNGGTLRFQAQYLRKIPVPRPGEIDPADRLALAEAFERRDAGWATTVALRVYGLRELPT